MKKIYTILMGTIIILSGCKKEDTSTGPEEVTKTIPVLTTIEVTNITSITATTGGNVTNDGGALVTSRGVCWGTDQDPTISNSKTTDGEGTGTFSSTITGLTVGTTYYVRAYATNSVGTSYGSTLSFTSSSVIPTLETVSISDITSTTALSGGIFSSDGGSAVTARGVCWDINENPLISDNKTTDGTGVGNFSSFITGLKRGTKYYVRAYATNNVGTSYGNQYSFTTTGVAGGTFIYNGYTYETVTIGSQEWTVENLRTTSYNDGSSISNVTDDTAWSNLVTGAYCTYYNEETNLTKYGYLYNWYAVNTGKLAPTTGGWRVPTDADWTKLTDYVGGGLIASQILKAESGWNNTFGSKSGNGTDDYGFSALPGGTRGSNGHFSSLGYYGAWWSSTAYDAISARYRGMHNDASFVDNFYDDYRIGFSIRLVRDK